LNEMLLRLSPRNEKIIKMLFFEGMSFDQVGEHFGITADRVRLLKEKSLRRLRKPDVIQSLKEVV
ncbi:MAG: Sigma-70, region 4, partial [Candidatus Parcubacteria bacterium]